MTEPGMTELTGAQRRFLRRQAHHIEPVIYVGKAGVTDNLVGAVKTALDAQELIKLKFNDFKEEKRRLSAEIAATAECHLVSIVGNIATLYRQHPNEERRRIMLPEP